jgi:hypothetical protein
VVKEAISKQKRDKILLRKFKTATTEDIIENIKQSTSKAKSSELLKKTKINRLFSSSSSKSMALPRKVETDVLEKALPYWTTDLERSFLNKRTEAKHIYAFDVNSLSWNDLGLIPMIEENLSGRDVTQKRIALLEKYQDGIGLTLEELNYMATTSLLLNSCVDKEYLQEAINLLDRHVLECVRRFLITKLDLFDNLFERSKIR